MKQRVIARGKLILNRLPYIALYFIAALVIFTGVDYVFNKWLLPDSYFLRNYTMTVTAVTEHTDVPIRICGDRRGNFVGDGVRTIYIITGNSGDVSLDREVAGSYELKEVSFDGDRCVNGYIKAKDFDHKAGRYIAFSNLYLKLPNKYNRVLNLTIRSNEYEIFPQSPRDLQQRIDELNEELQRLRNLQITINNQRLASPAPRVSSNSSSQVANQNSPQASNTPPNQPNEQQNPPANSAAQLDILNGLLKVQLGR